MNILKLLKYSPLFFLSLFMAASVNAEDIGKQPYSYWRVKQPNGLGIGLSLSSTSGVILFYDRNLDEKSQLHLQTSIGRDEAENIFGWEIITLSRTLIFGTYRRFFSKDKGFYYGIGAGYGGSKLEYTPATSNHSYCAEGNGIFALGEIGWQGKEGFYFHIGFQPALYLTYSDDFDSSQIPTDYRHRTTANDMWEDSENIIQLSIGFGWFF
ncbi:MAG: hypothetical protein DRG87_12650 [Deltaproteobacteria bacterium]|nr:MAG: hypothetical protein DRG87_12650 [Deltaproteobacteria bacterium]